MIPQEGVDFFLYTYTFFISLPSDAVAQSVERATPDQEFDSRSGCPLSTG